MEMYGIKTSKYANWVFSPSSDIYWLYLELIETPFLFYFILSLVFGTEFQSRSNFYGLAYERWVTKDPLDGRRYITE